MSMNTLCSIDRAFEILDKVACDISRRAPLACEFLPVRAALSRVVAMDQFSKLDLPGFDKSAMDGYAILEGDDSARFEVLGCVAAGDMPKVILKRGCAIKIMTGAPVPQGAGRVIPVEYASLDKDGRYVRFSKTQGAVNICSKGEDVKTGDLVLSKGTRLGPLEMANLIGCGITELWVFKPWKIAILTTGDEIVDDFEALSPGKIMNSNGPLLEGLCAQFGFEVVMNRVVMDVPEVLLDCVSEALSTCDALIFTGGVSMGDFDFVSHVLNKVDATVYFDRLALKPGKPMTFAAAHDKLIFGLPGNPVSVFLCFYLFVLRAFSNLTQGASYFDIKQLPKLKLAKKFIRKRSERTEWIPCKLTCDGELIPVDYHGSADLRALLKCEGFFIVPKGVGMLEVNEPVSFFVMT